ncbi:MAG: hypothetical protein PUK49_01240, partial [Oscillospiraceae bacterium]|nr:hypothetical protein [Oscillospiraceae bacterium]
IADLPPHYMCGVTDAGSVKLLGCCPPALCGFYSPHGGWAESFIFSAYCRFFYIFVNKGELFSKTYKKLLIF